MCKKLIYLVPFVLVLSLVSNASATIDRCIWEGIYGTAVSDLTSNPAYPDSPTWCDQLDKFDSPGFGSYKDNYGGRMQGFLVPETSGDYTFWIAADDGCELWLSSDEDCANLTKIAEHIGWNDVHYWYDSPEQQSLDIPLFGGQKYWIRALWKEGGGGDHCAVAWQGPDQLYAPVNGSDSAVIDGYYLMPADECEPVNTKPVADAGGPYINWATSWTGALIELDGSSSEDPDAVTYEWDLDLSFDSDGDEDPANDVEATGSNPEKFFPIGLTEISLSVVDEYGLRSKPDVTTVTVSIIEVDVEIRFDDDANTINFDSVGVVRITFLTDEIFDATKVDPESVTLRGLSFDDGLVKFRGKNESVPMVVDQDYDGDGDIDRVVNLDTERLADAEYEGVTYCEIGALTYDGFVVLGIDIAHLAPVAENPE